MFRENYNARSFLRLQYVCCNVCNTETPVDLFIFHFDIKKAVKFGMKIGGPLGSTLRVEHDPNILCVLNAFCVMGTITQN